MTPLFLIFNNPQVALRHADADPSPTAVLTDGNLGATSPPNTRAEVQFSRVTI
jgi:hypothetical protein